MAQTRVRSTKAIREEQLREDPAFRAYWQRTALAQALALPPGIDVVEDVTSEGSRVLVAAG